jgi:hypothetical protein
MVVKLDGVYYLDRNETVQYLMQAYALKWCMTKWVNERVKISYENQSKKRGYYHVQAFKIKKSSKIHLSKAELDAGMQVS